MRGDLPTNYPSLFYCINKYQQSHKSNLPNSAQLFHLSHTLESYSQGVQGYMDPLLQTLHCSMDVKTTNGKGMILKNVSSYVS